MTREKLPARRASWTQKVSVAGQTLHITFGEYEDGRLGEFFIDASKQGTFTRGILDALARVTSVSLQHGVPVGEIVKAMQGLNFPPNGEVKGSPVAHACTSIPDLIAQEMYGAYLGGAPKTSGSTVLDG